jgi:hypothetical protein
VRQCSAFIGIMHALKLLPAGGRPYLVSRNSLRRHAHQVRSELTIAQPRKLMCHQGGATPCRMSSLQDYALQELRFTSSKFRVGQGWLPRKLLWRQGTHGGRLSLNGLGVARICCSAQRVLLSCPIAACMAPGGPGGQPGSHPGGARLLGVFA